MSKLTFTEKAFEEYLYWQGQDKKNNLLPVFRQRSDSTAASQPEYLKKYAVNYPVYGALS